MTKYSFKQRIMIGTWNIRMLSEPSRLNQVPRNTFVIWDKSRINAVGLLISPKAAKILIQYRAISDQPDDKEAKANFYEQLDASLCSIHNGDFKIAIGDFNAKVGNDNSNLKSVVGTNGLDTIRNDNGDRLVDLCATHILFIGGTKCIHKKIHKYTWESPDGRMRNQIDHILISKLFLGCLLDVRTMRGADIDSDHNLILGTFKLRPAAVKPRKKPPKYNLFKLQDTNVVSRYEESVRQNFIAKNGDISWPDIHLACHQSTADVLGIQRRSHKPWITDETLKNQEKVKEQSLLRENTVD
ncbi:uncharacterized protein LOC142240141 [Haematobia irritans]|uniref:uncharacterized protein LOC142240141 n=1 Tax=Haematobia irritans TaxID=7368 RepID=UPI003F50604B